MSQSVELKCEKCLRCFGRKDNLKRHQQHHCKRKITTVPDTASPPSTSSLPSTSSPPSKKIKLDGRNVVQNGSGDDNGDENIFCCKCNITLPKNTYHGHLRSLQHKSFCIRPATEIGPNVEEIGKAFHGKVTTYRINNTSPSNIVIRNFLLENKEMILKLVAELLQKLTSIKINMVLYAEYFLQKANEDDSIFDIKAFNTKNVIVTKSSKMGDIFTNLMDSIIAQSEEFQEKDSGI